MISKLITAAADDHYASLCIAVCMRGAARSCGDVISDESCQQYRSLSFVIR